MPPSLTASWHAGLLDFVGRYPAIWPVLLFSLLMPAMAILTRPGKSDTLLLGNRNAPAFLFGAACLSLFAISDLANLFHPAFHENYESTGVSIGYSLFHGGQVYPAPGGAEQYSLPYGPVFFAIPGFSQWALGSGTFAAKLPCALAPLLALGVFWSIVRGKGASRSLALVLVGLEAALLLAIRHASFWTKSDPLILLVVTLGAWVVLRRDQRWSPWLGLCAGLAMGLKLSALVYFLPVCVLAYLQGWRFRALILAGVFLAAAFFLPFLLLPQQISLTNYFSFLQLVAREGFSVRFGTNYLRWVLMLTGLVIVSDHCMTRGLPGPGPKSRAGILYRLSLLAGFAVIAVPASAVGAGSNHHIPFIPLVLLACGNLFQPGTATIHWVASAPLLWRSSACAILLGTAMIAVKHTWWIVKMGKEAEAPAIACLTDLRQIMRQYPQHALLMGFGSASDCLQTRLRHELVLAGHPIGLDTAAVSDYQIGGGLPPRLGPLLEEIGSRDGRPPLWLLPRGDLPFTATNLYDSSRVVFPASFRHAFHEMFLPGGQSAFFDLYLPKPADRILATENLRNPVLPAKPPG